MCMQNLVLIDNMPATLDMAKRLLTLSKGASPGTRAISNIPFMAASIPDGLASGMNHKPKIPKLVTFQDSALLNCLQNFNKKLKTMDSHQSVQTLKGFMIDVPLVQ